MRLLAINISGFKSFCDPVRVIVREGLTGVVGPNGCGKSNIIDALRWGLGESRASLLRGGALQDVLFNGSGKRPPGDWCSVEIRLAAGEDENLGMWSGCSEIAVKRELDREGQSGFYINGRPVRRRDVVDLFRGTGVSPRSYAVVEQGMVGAIAEASPDELRRFLEETAGVAHYRDRRRDAERRLASSRANLEQLAQLLDSSRRRQESLKRQARAARRHREIGEATNDLEALLILQNLERARKNLAAKDEKIAADGAQTDALRARGDSLRAAAESARAEYAEWQRKARARDAELARLQAAAAQARRDYELAEQNRARILLRADAEKTEQQETAAAAEKCAEDKQRAETELETIRGELETCAADAARAETELDGLRAALHNAELETEKARAALAENEQRRAARQINIRMAEEKNRSAEARLAELRETLKQTETAGAEPPAPAEAEQKTAALEEAWRAAAAECKTLADEESAALKLQRAAENAHIAAEAGRAALQSLRDDGKWRGTPPPRIAETLHAGAGEWARALDSALGRFAAAHMVLSVDDFLQSGMPPPGAGIAAMPAAADSFSPRPGWTPLLDKVRADAETKPFLAARLRGVYAEETAEAARARRPLLAADEMVVIPDGAVFMRDAAFSSGEVRGGFDWQRRLAEINKSVSENAELLQTARRRGEECRRQTGAGETRRSRAEVELAAARAELSESRIARGQWEERRRGDESRRREVLAEIESAETALRELARETQKLAGGGEMEKTCETAAQQLAETQKRAETAARHIEDRRAAHHQSAINQRELGVRKENTARRIESLAAQECDIARRQKILAERIAAGEAELAQIAAPALADNIARHSAGVDRALAVQKESAAAEAEWERKITAAEAERENHLSELEAARERGVQLQLEKRELSITAERLDNSLEDYEQNEERLRALRERNLDAAALRAEIDAQRARRERLGAINFAAADEFAEGETRLRDAEVQLRDVEAAAAELQKTISRIDDETRACLRGVYENVNGEFGGLFRKLFGGGEAELAMDGNSFLDARFEIRARPPGKRMFPVRMLSGGEKSATALAFIFALMRRTPPPFCVMDEADATLDDRRTGALVGLLREMSEHFQCLVVTHNKDTIEAARHLIGVTQEEKGVSKIVSVTREEAARAAP